MTTEQFMFWLLIAANVGFGLGVWLTALRTDDPWMTVERLMEWIDD